MRASYVTRLGRAPITAKPIEGKIIVHAIGSHLLSLSTSAFTRPVYRVAVQRFVLPESLLPLLPDNAFHRHRDIPGLGRLRCADRIGITLRPGRDQFLKLFT